MGSGGVCHYCGKRCCECEREAVLNDIKDIRDTIKRAADNVIAHKDRIDANVLAMLVASINGKLYLLDQWINNPVWLLQEMVMLSEFITNWHYHEIQIEKMRPQREVEGYLDLYPPEQWFPIPAIEIPRRMT